MLDDCVSAVYNMCALLFSLQLEAELDRLEDLKRANMQKFIEATRAELAKVWDQCFFGHHQRLQFAPYYEGRYLHACIELLAHIW